MVITRIDDSPGRGFAAVLLDPPARIGDDVWIRPRSDVLAGHRLRLLDGRLLNIRAVLTPDVFLNRSRLICEQHSP